MTFDPTETKLVLAMLTSELRLCSWRMAHINPDEQPDMYASEEKLLLDLSSLIYKLRVQDMRDTLHVTPAPVAYDNTVTGEYVGPRCAHGAPISIPANDERNCIICTGRACIHGVPHTDPCLKCLPETTPEAAATLQRPAFEPMIATHDTPAQEFKHTHFCNTYGCTKLQNPTSSGYCEDHQERVG